MGDVTNIPFTHRERIVFNELNIHGERSAHDLTKIFEAEGYRAGSAIAQCVKYLGYKVAPYGYIITRTSRIGRGAIGVWKMEKRNG